MYYSVIQRVYVYGGQPRSKKSYKLYGRKFYNSVSQYLIPLNLNPTNSTAGNL
jgi:hypothetical protein